LVFVAEVEFDAGWQASHVVGVLFYIPQIFDFIVVEGLRELPAVAEADFDALEKLVGVGAAESGFADVLGGVGFGLRANMLKIVEVPHNHFAARGGTVMLEHVQERLEKKVEVSLSKTSACRERGRDVDVRAEDQE
jgi:hypothetical protein